MKERGCIVVYDKLIRENLKILAITLKILNADPSVIGMISKGGFLRLI